jgi:hypothetical protein
MPENLNPTAIKNAPAKITRATSIAIVFHIAAILSDRREPPIQARRTDWARIDWESANSRLVAKWNNNEASHDRDGAGQRNQC